MKGIDKVGYLKWLPLFNQLTDEQLSILAEKFNYIRCKKNSIIINRNKQKHELYFVISGKVVSTLKLPNTLEREHGEYIRGDFFGEIYLGGNKPLYNSYVAVDDCELLSIHENGFLELIENHPQSFIPFISNLLSQIIVQFRKSSKFLADVVEWGEHASRRVITDELTGIYNRSFLEDALENFFSISKNNNKPLSFLMLDIDNYNDINKKFGHEIGNKILAEIVLVIQDCIRQVGILARYGGDEFSILLPEMDLKKALSIAEDIRSKVEAYDFSPYMQGADIPLTTSIGVCSFPETATDLEMFKKKADASLYQAKELGRNRIEWIK